MLIIGPFHALTELLVLKGVLVFAVVVIYSGSFYKTTKIVYELCKISRFYEAFNP